MKVPPRITYRHVDPTPALDRGVRRRIDRLGRYCSDIIACHVAIELPHNRRRKGDRYHVRVDLTVPGKDLVVNRHLERSPKHEELAVALTDAFRAARREIDTYARERRREVKAHSAPAAPPRGS